MEGDDTVAGHPVPHGKFEHTPSHRESGELRRLRLWVAFLGEWHLRATVAYCADNEDPVDAGFAWGGESLKGYFRQETSIRTC